MNDLTSRLDGLMRFTSDLEFRMADSGLAGVLGVAEQVRRIRRALERVQPDELAWARAETQALMAMLAEVARGLDELAEVKALLAGGAPQPFAQLPSDGYVGG